MTEILLLFLHTLHCSLLALLVLALKNKTFAVWEHYAFLLMVLAACYAVHKPVSFAVQKLSALLIIVFWIAGMIYHLRRLIKNGKDLGNLNVNDSGENYARASKMRYRIAPFCNISLYFSPEISVPVMTGCLHPAMYLPDSFYSDKELRYILLRGYIHWKRKDLWKKQLINIISSFIWWNPAVYMIRRELFVMIENGCDRQLLKNYGIKERAGQKAGAPLGGRFEGKRNKIYKFLFLCLGTFWLFFYYFLLPVKEI